MRRCRHYSCLFDYAIGAKGCVTRGYPRSARARGGTPHFLLTLAAPPIPDDTNATLYAMLSLATTATTGFTMGASMLNAPVIQQTRAADAQMLYGEPRAVQIIPSVLPADWANSALCPSYSARCRSSVH